MDYGDYGRAAEVRDSRRRWMEDVFQLLQSRAALFGEIYPFEVASDSFSLELRERTDERLAYVFYLGCSSLRYVDKKTEGVLTKLFEAVSADVLELLLPAPFVTDLFGTARGKRPSQFSGTLYKRIVALARELNGKVVVDEVDFHPRDTADNGLDLVAWMPASDHQPGVLSFLRPVRMRYWMGREAVRAVISAEMEPLHQPRLGAYTAYLHSLHVPQGWRTLVRRW